VHPTHEAQLDNPVYAALCGPHARFAQVRGRARRYHPDVAPFLAVPSTATAEDWQDAAHLIAPGTYAGVLQTGGEAPEQWGVLQTFEAVQMIGESVAGADSSEAVALTAADVPEMLDLVARTEPGPFLNRTIELGAYVGIRRDGALAAMAGERIRLEGWTEISAVCTSPAYRGQGLASALVGALIRGIERRSERAFLHVLSTNTSAIRLYEQLGFRVRRSATIAVVTPAAARAS
jgi:ribosomal protein S18 acetylase RimI-like enzyme